MENYKKLIAFLEEIAKSLDPELSLVERASLYAGGKAALHELEKHVESYCHNDSYAREKLFKAGWSLAAGLGIGEGNSHSAESHRAWMLGNLSTLSSVIDRLDDGE